MILAKKVRIIPTTEQEQKLWQSVGTARFIYNWTLARQEENYKNGGKFISDMDLRKEITKLKKTEEFKWLNEVSNNVAKQSVKDACDAYKKLSNIRNNYLHQATNKIVKTKPSKVVMETLNIKGMMKNKHLSKAAAQQGLYEFKRQLQYKCAFYGIEFVVADKWYPSSKTCSKCGYIKSKLSLSERTYICEECGAVIDRDFNASINLSRYSA